MFSISTSHKITNDGQEIADIGHPRGEIQKERLLEKGSKRSNCEVYSMATRQVDIFVHSQPLLSSNSQPTAKETASFGAGISKTPLKVDIVPTVTEQ